LVHDPPAPSISNNLKTVLRAVKIGRCLDTLPEWLALVGSRNLSHAQFLELVPSDEITRRKPPPPCCGPAPPGSIRT
jgi:hypothetical protein